MPISPRPSVIVQNTPPVNQGVPFDLTLPASDTASNVALVPSGKHGRKIDIVNEGPGHVAIKFDADAQPSDLLVKDGDAVSWDIDIVSRVSFINIVSGETPHLRGVLFVGPA